MKKTTITCDLCGGECLERFCVISGCVMKMNTKGQYGPMIFEAHYCEDHTGNILTFIEKLNDEQSKPTELLA